MPALTIMLLFSSFLPPLLTSIFGNFLAFDIKQVSRADLPGNKKGFVPLFLLDALSCFLAAILACQAIPVQCYSFSQKRRGTCFSPAAALCQGFSLSAERVELLVVTRQEFPRTSLHTPTTTGNCSGYYCNMNRNIHVSSARKPKFSNHKDSALTPPVLDIVCSLTSHLLILSCHIIIVLHALLCNSWLYIQSDAPSSHA